jgi:SAM-dependent methyltransferase
MESNRTIGISPHATSAYIIDGGEVGADRLALLAQVTAAQTESFLLRAGVRPGSDCIDLGCGPGHVTGRLAELAAPGRVVGVDFDPVKIDIAREATAALPTPPEFSVANVGAIPGALADAAASYDVVYARFLLSHLPNAAAALMRMAVLARPGGVVAVEEVDAAAMWTHPHCPALAHWIELGRLAAEAGGADARVGPDLPALFDRTGLKDVDLVTLQPSFRDGPGKDLILVTFDAMRSAVRDTGLATDAELDEIRAELARFVSDPQTIVSAPRVFQVIGRRPG